MKYSTFLPYFIALSSSLLFSCGGETDSGNTDTDSGSEENTSSALVINEIVAAAADDGNDWIELYAVEGSISLASYSIVDDNADREAQSLPDITLSEGEFVVIQAIDEEDTPPESGYYVTFKLGSDDAVTLLKDNVEVDTLDWDEGDAIEGSSYGLFADGIPNAQTLSPTPGTENKEITTEDDTVILDTIINEDAPLRINEIVAKSADGGHDWIELYVSGAASVNLSSYSLADDNDELAPLPDVTLTAGQFYRIYATTDEDTTIDTVSFKLGASDTVSLYEGTDLVDQLSWNKGQALLGFSYGRFPDGSDATQVLSPSAESSNVTAAHGPLVINEVLANDSNGGYDWFELYNNSNTDISLSNYQVLDESDDIDAISLPDVTLSPNEYIVIYATDEDINDYYVSFKLGNSDELSLILNDETVDYISWDSSDVIEGYSYGLTDSDSTTFDYALSWEKDTLTPTQGYENTIATAFDSTIVSNLYIDITTENWADILDNPTDEEYHEANITFNGVTLESIAIRTKGGSSLRTVAQSTSDRYSFKIDINEYVSGQKFFGLKKFTLQNSYNDPTYMREVLAYELLDEMGVPTPKNAYVNVYINDELFGFYLMVEAIDGEFLENHFANANGDLYKPDGTGSDLQWINDDIDSYSDINLQTNEDSTDGGAFINFVEALDNGSTDVIDVDDLLRYMSVSTSLSNLDSYHGTLAHNYYIYEQDGVFSLLPWDFNESFGTFAMNCNSVDIRELYIDEPTSGTLSERPLVANAFADQNNLDIYHTYLWQLINGPLANDTFKARVYEIADLIREHVENDPSAFYGEAAFEQNLTSSYGSFYGLTSFMEYRIANMTQQLQGTTASSGDGSGFCSGK